MLGNFGASHCQRLLEAAAPISARDTSSTLTSSLAMQKGRGIKKLLTVMGLPNCYRSAGESQLHNIYPGRSRRRSLRQPRSRMKAIAGE
jgi:hypothetical protein